MLSLATEEHMAGKHGDSTNRNDSEFMTKIYTLLNQEETSQMSDQVCHGKFKW